MAINNGWLQRDPFYGYSITKEETKRGFLTKEEITQLINGTFKKKSYELIRDLFIFKNGIKVIAKYCGIEKNVTWHQSRHSYATTVCLSNDVPIETLSKMHGHRSIRTTQIYAKITAEKVSRDMEKLSKQIEQMESFICQAI